MASRTEMTYFFFVILYLMPYRVTSNPGTKLCKKEIETAYNLTRSRMSDKKYVVKKVLMDCVEDNTESRSIHARLYFPLMKNALTTEEVMLSPFDFCEKNNIKNKKLCHAQLTSSYEADHRNALETLKWAFSFMTQENTKSYIYLIDGLRFEMKPNSKIPNYTADFFKYMIQKHGIGYLVTPMKMCENIYGHEPKTMPMSKEELMAKFAKPSDGSSSGPLYVGPSVPAYPRPSDPAFARPSDPPYAGPSDPAFARPSDPPYAGPNVPPHAGPSVPANVPPIIPPFARPSVPAHAGPSVPAHAGPSVPANVPPFARPIIPPYARPYVGPNRSSNTVTYALPYANLSEREPSANSNEIPYGIPIARPIKPPYEVTYANPNKPRNYTYESLGASSSNKPKF